MNVFVLTTGRAGSVTFARACSHIENWSSGHETRTRNWQDRFGYPDRHIEVDPRLVWWLGTLDRLYGEALYVWLRRDRDAVVESTAARTSPHSAISHWPSVAYWRPEGLSREDAAALMVDQMLDTIGSFLDRRPYVAVDIESPRSGFADLWHAIDAMGDYEAAMAEFSVRHNAR